MRKVFTKYIILIVITFITSIFIYNYVESFKSINDEKDIFLSQKNKEDSYLKNTDYTLENPNVILNPYGNSPLTALVIFQTKDLTTAKVTIKGKNGADDITHTFTPSKVHILPIYGLYAGYDNKVIIDASGKTKEITIKTDDLPADFSKPSQIDIPMTQEDFYFTTPEEIGYTAAFDSYGEVRWYIIGDYKWSIQRLSNGHILMSSDKTLSRGYSAGLTEMDLLGKIYYEYLVPGGYYRSVIELNNGNLLLLSNNNSSNTYEDNITEIDRNTGQVIKEINLNKLLGNNIKGNWFKATSIVYDVNTNSITVSGYNDNSLVNIDYSSLNINWIISKDQKNGLSEFYLSNDGNDVFPSKPLSVNIIGDNKLIFVNEENGVRYLTTYEIDYTSHSFNQVDNYSLGISGDANLDVINNSDYIVTSGKMIKEIIDNEDSASISITSSLYNTKKMPLYANDIYTGAFGERLGSLGVSEAYKNNTILFPKYDKSIFKKYDLKLYKDTLGLKISGKFNSNDNVEIILDNVLDKKTYKIDTNLKNVSRYVNEEGIKGKYYIYIRINGTIYKLYRFADFK